MLHHCSKFEAVKISETEARIVCISCGKVIRKFIDIPKKIYPQGRFEAGYSNDTLDSLV